ncbi:YacL family protein [Alteromonadaceae bacterium BrNp21-10]|nr:YacL family protein [Alteromonadaceae bacterium BrNp21-10]
MDYQFFHQADGLPKAEFSMGTEALGRWFTEELATDQQKITQLLTAIEQLEQQQIKDYELIGNEFSLRLNQDEIEIFANSTQALETEILAEDIYLYEQESSCGCGLEDFLQVLLSWQQFVQP